jgi:hypothetical protein
MSLNVLPTKSNAVVKVGQRVKFTDPDTGETIYGTVEDIAVGTENLIERVRVVREDGKVTFVEVTNLVVLAVTVIEPLIRLGQWIAGLFRKKNRKPRV